MPRFAVKVGDNDKRYLSSCIVTEAIFNLGDMFSLTRYRFKILAPFSEIRIHDVDDPNYVVGSTARIIVLERDIGDDIHFVVVRVEVDPMTTGLTTAQVTMDLFDQPSWQDTSMLQELHNLVGYSSGEMTNEMERVPYVDPILKSSKAKDLLLRHLSDEQRMCYKSRNLIPVNGSDGGRYYIYQKRQNNVVQFIAANMVTWCLTAKDEDVPTEDLMLSILFLLEADEKAFQRVANRERGYTYDGSLSMRSGAEYSRSAGGYIERTHQGVPSPVQTGTVEDLRFQTSTYPDRGEPTDITDDVVGWQISSEIAYERALREGILMRLAIGRRDTAE